MPAYQVIWEEPGQGQELDLQHALELVAKDRGRWARIAQCPTEQAAKTLAWRVRTRKVAVPKGRWDVKAVGTMVYARRR